MKTYEQLQEDVLDWAAGKNLLNYNNRHRQALKMVSEVGELCDSIINQDEAEIVDAIGDTLVTVIILAAQLGYNTPDCLESAYNVIKDRRGQTIDGTFIKES